MQQQHSCFANVALVPRERRVLIVPRARPWGDDTPDDPNDPVARAKVLHNLACIVNACGMARHVHVDVPELPPSTTSTPSTASTPSVSSVVLDSAGVSRRRKHNKRKRVENNVDFHKIE